MFSSLGNSIPTDWARRYTFDGSGNSTTGSNNATVTNGTWVKSQRMYQNQCLSWGASTTCTYTSVTYTNSYIWIYVSGVWTFTKNSAKVTSTALNGVNGERYAGLTFFNRTLTSDEEQLLELEGRKLLGPTNIAKYPKLFEGIQYYADFRGTAHNLVDGSLPTTNTATLTTDRFGNSNSAYSFNGTSSYITYTSSYTNNQDATLSLWVNITTNPTGQSYIFKGHNTQQQILNLIYITISGVQYLKLADITDSIYTASHTVNLAGTGWRHIIVTKSGTTQQIYLDGIAVGTAGNSGTGTAPFNTNINSIGRNDISSSQYFNGTIGEVIILNRGISSDECKLLYNLTSKDYIYPNPSYDLLNLRDGLVLDLNEQGKDLSGNGNNGTLVNSPVVVRQGKAKGLSYNGSNTYVNCGDILDIGTGNLSYSLWFNTTTSSAGTYKAIIGKTRANTNTGRYGTLQNSGNLFTFIQLASGVEPSISISETPYIDGKWHMLTVVINRTSNISLYLDGINKGNTSISAYSGVNLNVTDLFGIGAYLNSTGDTFTQYFFNGKIFNPRVRNRALSDKEIQALYYSQNGNFIY